MIRRCPLSLLLLLTIPCASVHAAVSWSFDYTGSAEFDTSAQGLARRASLEAAAASVGAWFNHTATVTIAVSSTNEAGSSTLASAGSNFPAGFTPGFGSSGYVRNRILTGAGNPAGADGTVNVNFTHNWDLDDSIAADAFDFKSTMIHELLHATGFSSDITQAGTDTFSTAPGTPGMFTLFDKFLTDAAGTPIIDQATFALNGALWTALSVGGGAEGNPMAGGVYFSGPKAMAANGGMPVRIFSPNPWQDGSSGSHLDDLFYEANLMMKAATLAGPGARTLTDFEKGMLQDLGYSMAGSTPPPGPTALAAWRTQYFGDATERIGNAEDFDGDGTPNLLEFALGTNPAQGGSGPGGLDYAGTFAGGGTLTKPGQPVIRVEGAGDARALYVRRKDFAAVGLTYIQRFTTDLATWQNSIVVPTVLADDGSNEVVSIPFPTGDGGGKAFFLLEVRIAP
jgi:hypothetical protein